MQVKFLKTSQEGKLFPLPLSHYKTQEQKVMKLVQKLIYCIFIFLMTEIILYHVTTSCIHLLRFPFTQIGTLECQKLCLEVQHLHICNYNNLL